MRALTGVREFEQLDVVSICAGNHSKPVGCKGFTIEVPTGSIISLVPLSAPVSQQP